MVSQSVCDASLNTVLLPVEILAHIFRTVCCIDARFHLTLRLVSRLCRDIARPLKYCSMFIQGPEHLHFVVQQLKQYPTNIPLVEHVALTDHLDRTRRDAHMQGYTPSSMRHQNMKMHITARPHDYSRHDVTFARDVRTFVDMVAPTLRTLHLSFYSWSPPTIYLEIFRPENARKYPRLEEIAYRPSSSMWPLHSITGEDGMSAGGDGIIPTRIGRKIFPRLRRLWFSGVTLYGDGAQEGFLNDLAMACPELTHLRLHEPHTAAYQSIVSRFMRWHGVRLEENHQLCAQIPGAASPDWRQTGDVVVVLQSNALLGFPHLQRLIIDLQPESRRPCGIVDKVLRGTLYSMASRRHEVVIRRCHDCSIERTRVPLSFARDLFEKSVGGHPELWPLKNEVFRENEAKRWQPIRVAPPIHKQLIYRENIALGLPQVED